MPMPSEPGFGWIIWPQGQRNPEPGGNASFLFRGSGTGVGGKAVRVPGTVCRRERRPHAGDRS